VCLPALLAIRILRVWPLAPKFQPTQLQLQLQSLQPLQLLPPPMTSFPRLPAAAVTTSCRPIFLPGEVERYLLPGVDLESDGSDRPALLLPFKSSLLALTSHRLVFIDEASASAREIPLSAIIHVFPLKKSMSIRSMFASPRVRLQAL
jgi:Vacuolar protein sorting protein 36 Vps36